MYYKRVKLTSGHWKEIRNEMLEEYPKSIVLIKANMLKVLGIEVREDGYSIVHLDFYDSQNHMLFLLKYSHIIEKSNALVGKWESVLQTLKPVTLTKNKQI